MRRSGRSRLCYQAQNATVCPHPIISIHGAKQQTPVATNDTSRNKTRRAPGKCSCRPTKLQTVKGLYGAYEPGFVSLDAHNCVQTNGREVETEDGTNRINPSPEFSWRISLTAYAERPSSFLRLISLPVLIYDNHRRGHIPPGSWKLVAAVATSISLARGYCAVIKPVFRTSSRT